MIVKATTGNSKISSSSEEILKGSFTQEAQAKRKTVT